MIERKNLKKEDKNKSNKFVKKENNKSCMEVKSLKIIFTKEDKKSVRKSIEGFRNSYIVDARELLLEMDYEDKTIINSPQDFIINKELEKKLSQALINKKSQQVIYFHYSLSSSFIKNIKKFFKERNIKPEYCIFDPHKEYKTIHNLFDKIIK